MNPRFYISALIALLLLPAVRSALASEVLYEDDFTTLDPSWGALGENLSVGSTHFYVFFTGNLLGRFLRHCASANPTYSLTTLL